MALWSLGINQKRLNPGINGEVRKNKTGSADAPTILASRSWKNQEHDIDNNRKDLVATPCRS